jgi:hypothetical protein
VLADVKSFKKQQGKRKTSKAGSETLGCLIILRVMAVIAFQVFIKHTAVIARRIL